ncbi:uncharacterized protein LOC114274409 isoform X3 [Camellia sinensis]|uniref:uncharacterized protein LOC114274409 isoform X3 n=1 Tax=Camellia sinensis TaxID=4442 RepID=UPI001035C094|nr:uncharacterized protein LOC114274409 isoform X3 [Camellia sinensis]
METLSSSSSMVFSDNYRDRGYYSPRDVVGRQEIRFLSSPAHVRLGFSHSISLQHKMIQPIFVSSETQKNLQNEETQIQDTSKTVHVKIPLQKECAFGEKFHIVGDDIMFGSWDPLSAIPLDWSDGHVWTVELQDIPIGKSIQFKFILKGSTGNILWQPGPNRILETWETKNTVLVSENWDYNELRMLIEEEPTSIENIESTSNTDTLIVVEDLSQARVDKESASTVIITNNPTEKPLPGKSLSMVAENIIDPVKEPRIQTRTVDYAKEEHVHNPMEKPLPRKSLSMVAENITDPVKEPQVQTRTVDYAKEERVHNPTEKPLPGKSLSMVAENITDPVKEPRVQTRTVDYAKEEHVHVSNKDMVTGENALGNNDWSGTPKSFPDTKDEANLASYEGDPVLIPGLTPLTTEDTEETSPSKDRKHVVANAPLGVDKQADEHNVPEIFHMYSNQMKKIPNDNDSSHPKDSAEMMFNDKEEQLHGNEQTEPVSKQLGDVLENDVQWGRRTLQKLLTSFGFFWL